MESFIDVNPLLGNIDVSPVDVAAFKTRTANKIRNAQFYVMRKINKFRKLPVHTVETNDIMTGVRDIKVIDSKRKLADILNKENVLTEKYINGGIYSVLPDLVEEDDYHIEDDRIVLPKRATTEIIVGETYQKVNNNTHTNDISQETATDFRDEQFEMFKLPNRRKVNSIVQNRRYLKSYGKLFNYLKCKYFMKRRDTLTMNNMISDARVWLLKNNYTTEHDMDYVILTTSVISAFMVTQEELEFRKQLKDRTNYGNMCHLNDTLNGTLGKVNPFFKSMRYKDESIFHNMLSDLTMPGPKLTV
jgi:hypothetical protein